MIELNLLPENLRKRKRKSIQMARLPLLGVAAGVLALMVIIHLFLFAMIRMNRSAYHRTKAEWDRIQPRKKIADEVVNRTNNLQKRMDALKELADPAVDWTRLLSGLNQAMIPDVWLSEFSSGDNGKGGVKGKTPRYFMIIGYVLGESDVATVTTARFIDNLEHTKDFSDYFRNIELVTLNSARVEGQEAMLFKLSCELYEKKEESK